MKSGKIFEIGSIIIADGASMKDIKKTLESVVNQTIVARKIVVLCTKRKFNVSKSWINETSMSLAELGVQDFKFMDILMDEATLSQKIAHVFKEVMFKPMSILIHNPDGDKKGYLKLTHFSVIEAGAVYSDNKYFETVSDVFMEDKKAFVYYSNMTDKKINITDLTDSHPVTFHTYGFDFFIDHKSSDGIIDRFRDIRKERMAAKKEDEAMNDVDHDSSYQDFIFCKIGAEVSK